MNQYLRRKIWTLNRSGKFRGYLRTVSGYPVTLTDCIAGQPVSLAVDGNAVQDGTPTPDNPVDVQLCGDRTVNLFDKTLLKIATTVRGGGVGSTWEYNSNKIKMSTEKIYVKPNTQYTVIVYNNDIYWRDRIIESDANDICTCNHNHYTIDETYEPRKNLKVYTFVSKENTEYIIIRFMRTDCAEISYNDVTNVKCMLIEGAYTAETMPAYEPYGYKVPLTMTGINLLSNNENDWVSDAGIYKHFKIPVEGTTTLQLKLKEGKSIPEKLYLGYSKNGMDATGGVSWLIAEGRFNYGPIHANSSKYISIHPKTALLDEIFDSLDIMLIEGAYTTETMPAYEPYREPQTFNIYTPQQLAKVGDTADTVVLDFDNKRAKLVKRYYRYDFTGEENWLYESNNNRYSVALNLHLESRRYRTPSNRFITIDGLALENNFVFAHHNSFYVYCNSLTTLEELKKFLVANPTYAYIPLATPITTDITALQDWDAMPSLWSGTAVITADTVIAPSAITVKYYASKPEEVN